MSSVRKVKNSSNDQRGIRCKYLEASFWVNPKNLYFLGSPYYSHETQMDLIKRLVYPAQHEMEKKHKEDFLPK